MMEGVLYFIGLGAFSIGWLLWRATRQEREILDLRCEIIRLQFTTKGHEFRLDALERRK